MEEILHINLEKEDKETTKRSIAKQMIEDLRNLKLSDEEIREILEKEAKNLEKLAN